MCNNSDMMKIQFSRPFSSSLWRKIERTSHAKSIKSFHWISLKSKSMVNEILQIKSPANHFKANFNSMRRQFRTFPEKRFYKEQNLIRKAQKTEIHWRTLCMQSNIYISVLLPTVVVACQYIWEWVRESELNKRHTLSQSSPESNLTRTRKYNFDFLWIIQFLDMIFQWINYAICAIRHTTFEEMFEHLFGNHNQLTRRIGARSLFRGKLLLPFSCSSLDKLDSKCHSSRQGESTEWSCYQLSRAHIKKFSAKPFPAKKSQHLAPRSGVFSMQLSYNDARGRCHHPGTKHSEVASRRRLIKARTRHISSKMLRTPPKEQLKQRFYRARPPSPLSL